MEFLHILTLAAVQGLTEFLPVSSSGHLILVPYLTGWPDQGLNFDIAVHVGTLMAVLLYFWRDVWMIARDTLTWPAHRKNNLGARLFAFLLIGTIPAVIFGVLYKHFYPDGLRSVELVAANMILFGLIMGVVDHMSQKSRDMESLSWKHALLIGIAQAMAIIPGVSRSGITITAARLFHINRVDAARFSMLLAIPTIIGAAALDFKDMIGSTEPIPYHDLGMGIVLAFLFGLFAISFMMKWLQHASLKIFTAYRLILGGLLLLYFA